MKTKRGVCPARADQVALPDQGRLIAEGTPEELKRLVGGGHVRLAFADAGTLEHAATALGVAACDGEALALQVTSDGSVRSLRALLDQLDHEGIQWARALFNREPSSSSREVFSAVQ